ncbi:MAG TPA: acetolactate synthase small subunit [Dehalococcoidales bacterium]|nr:acetolactate synthase small subunit [Dehalococcoidales bacterium]
MKHTLVALVEDKPGVLTRMASLFRRRGFNIESIAVGHSELPDLSRMTIVVSGSANILEQVRKQLSKVVDVVKVVDVTGDNITARELALIKVRATSSTRSEIIEIADIFRANIVDVASDSLTIEITGDEDKVDSLLNLLRGFGIKEIARTGRIAMLRGSIGQLRVEEKISRAANNRQEPP